MAAVVLYRAMLATFDRCLGRMSERRHFPKPARRRRRRLALAKQERERRFLDKRLRELEKK